MGGGVSPIYREPGKYLLPLERMVESYRRQDPPPIPQLAVPVLVAESCYETGNQKNATPRMRATGELSIIAFYFLLRIGEYTMPSRIHERWDNRLTRTVQFTVGNISFWREGMLLDSTNATDISNADEATMKLTNQKNGQKNGIIHHEACDENGDGLCPVKALAQRVTSILANGGTTNTLLCAYWDKHEWKNIIPEDIGMAIKIAVVSTGLDKKGITPNDVGTHSLRAGGAMALKLNNVSDTTIKKAGRWTSMAFLQYLHNQIGHLSAGISKAMKKKVPFRNIGGTNKWSNGVKVG